MQGKVVFITGAARGIGAAVAKELACRGARIALTGLELDELEARARELGPGHYVREVDVTDLDAVRAAVAATVGALGGIDVVIANAGIAGYGTIEHGDPKAWRRVVDVNLTGVFHTVHAALPHILDRRGYVLAVASVASFMGMPGMSSYCSSKAAVESFIRALRSEVGHRGVHAGSAHPSWIDTDLVRDATTDLASFRLLRATMPWPLKATHTADECARAIADGVARRRARIYVPRAVGLIYWLRSLFNTRPVERTMERTYARAVEMLDAEVKALGRPSSKRTTAINRLL
jgi:hypothetical protein